MAAASFAVPLLCVFLKAVHSESACVKDMTEQCTSDSVCCSRTFSCFEKNQDWAACSATCVPGLHQDDPVKYQTPWTCAFLTHDSANHAPTTDEVVSQMPKFAIALFVVTLLCATLAVFAIPHTFAGLYKLVRNDWLPDGVWNCISWPWRFLHGVRSDDSCRAGQAVGAYEALKGPNQALTEGNNMKSGLLKSIESYCLETYPPGAAHVTQRWKTGVHIVVDVIGVASTCAYLWLSQKEHEWTPGWGFGIMLALGLLIPCTLLIDKERKAYNYMSMAYSIIMFPAWLFFLQHQYGIQGGLVAFVFVSGYSQLKAWLSNLPALIRNNEL